MSHKRLITKGGTKFRFFLDPLTLFCLSELQNGFTPFLGGTVPSHSLIVRRALRLYHRHLQDLKPTRENVQAELTALKDVRERTL